MTLVDGRVRGRRVSDGLDAVRLIVFFSLVIDVVSSLIGSSYGVSDLGRTGIIVNVQTLVVIVAVAACLWGRTRTAIALSVAASVAAVVLGPTGTEPWLIVVTGVVIAVRARVPMVALGAVAHVGYAVAFAVDVELRRPGWGWPAGLTTIGFSAVAFVVGLVTRRLLRARDARRARILALQQENAAIHVTERLRLADDLQSAVIRGLTDIERVIRATRNRSDVSVLRRTLTEVDAASRSLAGELRVLLDVLRSDLDAETDTSSKRATGLRTGRFARRAVRVVVSAGCALLALRALLDGAGVLGGGSTMSAGAYAVEILGLLACAVAVLHPAAGAVGAAAALIVAIILDPPGAWDVLPASLLCLLATLRFRARGLALAAVGLIAYAGLVIIRGADDPFWRLTAIGYGAVLAATVGLVVRHLLDVRRDLSRDELDVRNERQRLEAEERGVVARELHDVVAHQLSVSTLLVLSTSASDDPAVLSDTLERVGRSTEAARHELDTLLRAMRGPAVDQTASTSFITSRASVASLVERLAEHGYRAVVDIDPVADGLDATTQRTLSRILQEGTTNILRYAPDGSMCRYTLDVADTEVRLDIVSPMEPTGRVSDLSSGWGLRGIRERVELVHGTFRAGPNNGSWVVSVALPLIGGRTEPVAALG